MTLIKDLIDIPERVQKGDFVLRLAEDVRKSLFASRARLIGNLYSHLHDRATASTAADRSYAQGWISVLTSRKAPHANCMRCFEKLYQSDASKARDVAVAAQQFLSTISN